MFESASDEQPDLAERLRETERLIAVLHGEQLDLMVALHRRAPDWIVTDSDTPGLVDAAEVAAAEIGVALRISRPAATQRLGLALSLRDLPATTAALRSGQLSLTKARIISEAVAGLSAEHAADVETRVLPRAADQTPSGLGISVARAVLSTDPDAARRRRAQAVRERTVGYSPGVDGMASLWARLPAEDALGCYRQLCELADLAVRSDADGDPIDGADDRTADARRADTLVDLLMGAATAQRRADAALQGQATRPTTGARVDVTVAWTTLAGLDDLPGWLDGYGPVHADVARDISTDATWRRLLTDPATGTVLDVGTTRYTPSAALATLVRARDKVCRWYGCRQPAVRCDLDHTEPFPRGPTARINLAGLCRGHHRIKTHTTWRVEQDGHGVLTWISPLGQRISTEPWPRELSPPRPSARQP